MKHCDDGRLFRARRLQRVVGLLVSVAYLLDALGDRLRHIHDFLLHSLVMIEGRVARRIRLVIADKAVKPRLRTGFYQSHPVAPIAPRTARSFDTGNIAMYYEAISPARQMLRVIPAGKLDFLRLLGRLAVRRGGIGIAAVRANEAIH